MSELVTAEEIADRLCLRPSTIKRWAQENIIPALRLSGKVVRFDPEAVERALRARAAQTQPHFQEIQT
ncbi:MAG: helix-turn-helix domain-containing protein [Candidatus Hydrogenedentales bacterium]|jgi:excisionase family DNA binding protein